MRLLACIALFAIIATSAPAADVPRSCAEHRCTRFTIVGREVVREGKDGALVWTRGTWVAQTPEPNTVDAYFFCSITRPARITVDEAGDTKTVMLAPLSGWEYDNHRISTRATSKRAMRGVKRLSPNAKRLQSG